MSENDVIILLVALALFIIGVIAIEHVNGRDDDL